MGGDSVSGIVDKREGEKAEKGQLADTFGGPEGREAVELRGE